MINCVYQPFKAVSLLAILKHNAASFWSICQILEKVVLSTTVKGQAGKALAQLSAQCSYMGLKVSQDQIESYMSLEEDDPVWHDFKGFASRVSSVIQSELKSKTFVFVPEDRAKYLETEWVSDLSLLFVFDKAEKELLAAGRCYAYGEADASVFHSMRALEPCLEALAHALNVTYDRTNWQQAISNIEKKIRQLSEPPKEQGKKMTEEDRKDREFYSELATQFVFVKDGWRNHTMHGTRNYSDREARIIMDTVGNILRVAATRLEEVSDEQRGVQSGSIEGPKSLSRGDEEKA
jgi:hypothetical protein